MVCTEDPRSRPHQQQHRPLEHSESREAILWPAELSVRKWSRLIPRQIENGSVNNHCKQVGCYAHSLENDPSGTDSGRHPSVWNLWMKNVVMSNSHVLFGLTVLKTCFFRYHAGCCPEAGPSPTDVSWWAWDSDGAGGHQQNQTLRGQSSSFTQWKATSKMHDAENPMLLCSFLLVTERLFQSHLGKLHPPWPTLTFQLLGEELSCNNSL